MLARIERSQTVEAEKNFKGFMNILPGRCQRSWHRDEVYFHFRDVYLPLHGGGVEGGGGDRMGSNNILGKNLVPSNFHFLVFHKTVFLCRGAQNKVWCVLHKEPLMACLCELPWHWSQPSSAGPTAPIRQYTPLCVAIYERSEMNWEMAGVKNMWPYKYQSQTAHASSQSRLCSHLAVLVCICCWDSCV